MGDVERDVTELAEHKKTKRHKISLSPVREKDHSLEEGEDSILKESSED